MLSSKNLHILQKKLSLANLSNPATQLQTVLNLWPFWEIYSGRILCSNPMWNSLFKINPPPLCCFYIKIRFHFGRTGST